LVKENLSGLKKIDLFSYKVWNMSAGVPWFMLKPLDALIKSILKPSSFIIRMGGEYEE